LSFFDDKMEGLMANTKIVGRGGCAVDAHGTERPLGFWPSEFSDASPVSWVGRHQIASKQRARETHGNPGAK
jgi:hypothetical protein